MVEFVYSNVGREMEAYGFDSVTRTHCRMCHGGCGALVYTKNGKIEKIAGDPRDIQPLIEARRMVRDRL